MKMIIRLSVKAGREYAIYTSIEGGRGFVKTYIQPTIPEIKAELISILKDEFIARRIISRLQQIRINHDFFSDEFRDSPERKLSFFRDCLELLKDNELPIYTGGFRDQCIIRVIGPFFKFQQRQKYRLAANRSRLPEPNINLNDILDIMKAYKIPVNFIKYLYALDDEMMLVQT